MKYFIFAKNIEWLIWLYFCSIVQEVEEENNLF